jgi:hypothetical protein
VGNGRAQPIDDAKASAYAEAERLAENIANIASKGLKVRWSSTRSPKRAGDIDLDPALLADRRGWDLPHRIDALVGLTLRDAVHALRTPHGFQEPLEQMLAGEQSTSEALAEAKLARLRACFLLVEASHVTRWLNESFPGFRGYDETIWAWRISRTEALRRLTALRRKPTFGTVLNAAVTLMAHRGELDEVAPEVLYLLGEVASVLASIGPASAPAERFEASFRVYRLLEYLPSAQSHENRAGRRTTSNARPNSESEPHHTEDEQLAEIPNGTLEERQAALEAMTAIALNGLDPNAPREGLSPAELRKVRGMQGNTRKYRGSGKDAEADPDADKFVLQQRVLFAGRRPMRLITPPVDAHARMLYDASYARMRPQIDALRRVLKFRLVERRYAQYAQASGQLDEQALYRLAADDTRVFLRKSIESAPDQDLCVLLDESASMGRGQQHVRATVILFHHALRDLPGVRHWIFGFSGYGSGIALYRYVSPSSASLQDPRRLGAVASREATPLGEAVAGAAEAMLEESRGRERLMIVVTDGQPDDIDGARKALRAAEGRGITIIGLGITADTKASAQLFNHFTLYEDLETLPRKVGATLRRVVHGAS